MGIDLGLANKVNGLAKGIYFVIAVVITNLGTPGCFLIVVVIVDDLFDGIGHVSELVLLVFKVPATHATIQSIFDSLTTDSHPSYSLMKNFSPTGTQVIPSTGSKE